MSSTATIVSMANMPDVQGVLGYNVRNSGATGNGTTDDTASFLSEIAKAAVSANGVAAVAVPPGTYRITANLSLDGVSLIGAGRGRTVIIRDNVLGSGSPVITCTGAGGTLRGLTVTMPTPSARRDAYHGIKVVQGSRWLVSDCEVSNCLTGIGVDHSTDVTVIGNFVHDTAADGIYLGADTDLSRRVSVIGNHVSNAGDDSISCNSYLVAQGQNSDIVISGNTVQDGRAAGIKVQGSGGVIVSGNTVNNTYLAGIILLGGGGFYQLDDCIVSGNIIRDAGNNTTRGNGDAGISLPPPNGPVGGIVVMGLDHNVSNVKIVGNDVHSAIGNPVAVFSGSQNIYGVEVSGNTLVMGAACDGANGKDQTGSNAGLFAQNVRMLKTMGNRIVNAWGPGFHALGCIGEVSITDTAIDNPCAGGNVGAAVINSGHLIYDRVLIFDTLGRGVTLGDFDGATGAVVNIINPITAY